MDSTEWSPRAEEDAAAFGFPEFDESGSADFSIRPVDIRQHPKDDLLGLAVGLNSMAASTGRHLLLRRRLDRAENFAAIQLPGKGVVPTTKAVMYTDLCGYHCLVVVGTKAIYYVNYQSETVYALGKLQGVEITAVAFHSDIQPNDSGVLLIGGADGAIYTYRVELEPDASAGERVIEDELRCVFQLPNKATVFGLIFESYLVETKGKGTQHNTLVLAATTESCYQFVGPETVSEIFKKYREAPGELEKTRKSFAPLPSGLQSELRPYYRFDTAKSRFSLDSFVWKTSVGACCGSFRQPDDSLGPILVRDFLLVPYQKQQGTTTDLPQSITIDNKHIFMLYLDNITVVSRKSQEIEFASDFRPADHMAGMVHDPVNKCVWMYSPKNLYRMVVGESEKAGWRAALENGEFDSAMEACQDEDNRFQEYVAGAYADAEFSAKHTQNAAVLYARSNLRFEEVVNKFLKASDNEGLECYLLRTLARYTSTGPDSPSPVKRGKLTQRVALCAWILQLKLDRLGRLLGEAEEPLGKKPTSEDLREKERARADYQQAEGEFRQFLDEQLENVEAESVFQLLQSYGRFEDCLTFAKKKVSFSRIEKSNRTTTRRW